MLFVKNYQHTVKNPSSDTEICLTESQAMLILRASLRKLNSNKKNLALFILLLRTNETIHNLKMKNEDLTLNFHR